MKHPKRNISLFFMIILNMFQLGSPQILFPNNHWIKVTPTITGQFTVNLYIKTNLPDSSLLSAYIALKGQKPNDVFIGTDFERFRVQDGKATIVINCEKKAIPFNTKLPSGEYNVDVSFYPNWKENSKIAQKENIIKPVEGKAVLTLSASGISPPNHMMTEGYNKNLVSNYKIIKEKDISIKALKGKLSDYNNSDIQKLPLNIRKDYRITLPNNISKEQAKSTMIHLVLLKIEENSDIDEIVVFAYERESQVNGSYTLAKLEWCPKGIWGEVDPFIASNNDRSNYKFVFDFSSKFDQSNNVKKPTEREFQIYEYVEKELWRDVNTDEEIIFKNVAQKYRLSVNELKDIYYKVMTYNLR